MAENSQGSSRDLKQTTISHEVSISLTSTLASVGSYVLARFGDGRTHAHCRSLDRKVRQVHSSTRSELTPITGQLCGSSALSLT